MSDYEPPAEMVEALAKEMKREWTRPAPGSAFSGIARFVLRRQHERERGLLEALRQIAAREVGLAWHITAADALAAHAKLDAPGVPTRAECEARLRDLWAKAQCNKIDGPLSDALDAWKAAVEREEKR